MFSKCEFWLREVAFLGYIVLDDGIWVDLKKTETVKNCPRPLSLSNVRNFLDLAGYYRKFIE